MSISGRVRRVGKFFSPGKAHARHRINDIRHMMGTNMQPVFERAGKGLHRDAILSRAQGHAALAAKNKKEAKGHQKDAKRLRRTAAIYRLSAKKSRQKKV